MAQPTRFRINTPQVIQETIEGEVVIVHLEKGHYYSMMATGADIWNGIERGLSQSEILAEMLERYQGSPEEIEQSLSNLLEQLQQETIIVPAESNGSQPATETSTSNEKVEKQLFEPPVLQKYTDMEELLLLDPIHEVDETEGWPARKTEVEQ